MTAQYDFIIDTGLISADTADLLADVQNEWKAAFGANLNTDTSTPQGTMIDGEVIARSSVMKNNAELANLLNPNYAYGIHLDAIGAFLGIDRDANSYTTGVGVEITGDPNTVIPEGQRLATAAGDKFETVGNSTIGSARKGTITIRSQEYGEVALGTQTLTIIDGIIGWGDAKVTNNTVVTLGTTQLTDAQFRNRRKQRLHAMGIASTGAIKAHLLALPNVHSVKIIENLTGAAGTVDGITFTLPSGIWVCVSGTAKDAEIAAALYASHQGGCPWDSGAAGMGNPKSQVTDDPYTGVSYTAKWATPKEKTAYVHITLEQGTSTANQVAVQNAMLNYANGLEDDEEGLVVGQSVSSFEMAGAVARQLPGFYIKDCVVSAVDTGAAVPAYPAGYSKEVVLKPYEQAKLSIGNIIVVLS